MPVESVRCHPVCPTGALAFYANHGALQEHLDTSLDHLGHQRPWLVQQVSVTWLRYEHSLVDQAAPLSSEEFWALPVAGASHAGATLRYPASVVKVVYMAALEAWYAQDLLRRTAELEQATAAMIGHSSNDATAYVVDVLSGVTSGPELTGDAYLAWQRQRQLVNQWLQEQGWPELQHCNCCQKTWEEGTYGRERQFYGPQRHNRNRLSSDAMARVLHAVMAGELISPVAGAHMRRQLRRSLDAQARLADPDNQVDGFLGAALPEGSRLWSKAGWMSTARADVAYMEVPQRKPTLVAVLGEGAASAADDQWLPQLMARLLAAC